MGSALDIGHLEDNGITQLCPGQVLKKFKAQHYIAEPVFFRRPQSRYDRDAVPPGGRDVLASSNKKGLAVVLASPLSGDIGVPNPDMIGMCHSL